MELEITSNAFRKLVKKIKKEENFKVVRDTEQNISKQQAILNENSFINSATKTYSLNVVLSVLNHNLSICNKNLFERIF